MRCGRAFLLPTRENSQHHRQLPDCVLLRSTPAGAIRLNLLTDRVDIVQDLGWRRNTSALTDTDVKYLLLYFERNYELTSEKKITAALSIVANENCYHPIQDVLNSLVWDGTPRIRSCLHHFLGADESDYVEEMLKHFLLGAIRRVFRPGSKYEESFVWWAVRVPGSPHSSDCWRSGTNGSLMT